MNLVGAALFDIGHTDEAEGCFSALLKLAGDAGDEEWRARAANNLGMIASCRGRGLLEQAEDYYHRGLEIALRVRDTRLAAIGAKAEEGKTKELIRR